MSWRLIHSKSHAKKPLSTVFCHFLICRSGIKEFPAVSQFQVGDRCRYRGQGDRGDAPSLVRSDQRWSILFTLAFPRRVSGIASSELPLAEDRPSPSPPLSQPHPHRGRIALDEAVRPGRLVTLVEEVSDGNLQIQAGETDVTDGRTQIEKPDARD